MSSNKFLRQKTVKSFLTGGLAAFVLICSWQGIQHQRKADGIPLFLRKALEVNEAIWRRIYDPGRIPPQKEASPGTRPRVNGDLGLKSPVDLASWRLHIYEEDTLIQSLSMEDFQSLPITRTSTEFYCIEGWSTQFTYSGIKFSDFLKAHGLSKQYRYVGLETPDRKYYVSIDLESMLHPQTLLANEMNDRPLSVENGAPLRLIIPIKYGVKSLKRLGILRFSNSRLPDYWTERGYDWYSGL